MNYQRLGLRMTYWVYFLFLNKEFQLGIA